MDGRIVIISGPSGVGKSTVVSQLMSQAPVPLVLSISATTREPRSGEEDGVSYFFLSDDDFRQRRENGEFLECKEVFGRGYWYGTLKSAVASGLSEGNWVLLEIDVEGALSVKAENPDVIMIFIRPESMEVLESRLRSRCSDSEESIKRRLEVARSELARADQYDYVVENRTVEQSVAELSEILQSESAKQT